MSHADPFGQGSRYRPQPYRVLSKAEAASPGLTEAEAERVNFDLDAWLDAHDDAPAREELEPDYSSDEAA